MDRALRLLRAAALVGGALLLLGIDCGGSRCDYGGTSYDDGATFPSQDGCNSCSCSNGRVACTARACAAQWYVTCGDPVCGGHRVDPNVPACTTQKPGDPCASLGATCDPGDACNAHYQCAVSDPKQPNGCPISLARYKRDIHYLAADERARVGRDLLDVRLATWRYRADGAAAPERLGFIIDDVGRSPSVRPDGESVDLYGYTSMAVAAVQEQARQIAELQSEVRALRRQCRR